MFHLEQEIISINRLKLKCFVEGKKKNHQQNPTKLTFTLQKGNVLTASAFAVLCLQKEQSTENSGVHFFSNLFCQNTSDLRQNGLP